MVRSTVLRTVFWQTRTRWLNMLIRATVLGSALTMLLYAKWTGMFDVLRVTGGASRSPGIRQTLVNVFQTA